LAKKSGIGNAVAMPTQLCSGDAWVTGKKNQ